MLSKDLMCTVCKKEIAYLDSHKTWYCKSCGWSENGALKA